MNFSSSEVKATMTDTQQREAARQFYYRWKDKGKEDEDARSFWIVKTG